MSPYFGTSIEDGGDRRRRQWRRRTIEAASRVQADFPM
jgi:hypothetical protein